MKLSLKFTSGFYLVLFWHIIYFTMHELQWNIMTFHQFIDPTITSWKLFPSMFSRTQYLPNMQYLCFQQWTKSRYMICLVSLNSHVEILHKSCFRWPKLTLMELVKFPLLNIFSNMKNYYGFYWEDMHKVHKGKF